LLADLTSSVAVELSTAAMQATKIKSDVMLSSESQILMENDKPCQANDQAVLSYEI
jgi:hypothetical protein